MRYFADGPLPLDAIKKGLAQHDPSFKIDGGEVSLGGHLLAEIELTRPPSDMFGDEIAGVCAQLQHAGGHAAYVIQRLQTTQAVMSVRLLDGNAMDQLQPLWTVLSGLATGLWHLEGQGFYDQGQLLVAMA